MQWRIYNMGEAALLAEPVAGAADTNRVVHAVAGALERLGVAGLERPVVGAASLLLAFDPRQTAVDGLIRAVQECSRAPFDEDTQAPLHTIGVRYGGADGPDLDEVAETLRMAPSDVVARHCAVTYRVLLLGFAPGFPYLGPLPEVLRLPRRAVPRVAVPAGSVAIAAEYSGIYPSELPGGWHLLGRCTIELFNPRAEPPALLRPGDAVRFEPLPGGVLP